MDPVTTGIVTAGKTEVTAAVKKESDTFLKAVYGEPARALGGLIADKINKRRHANLVKITVEAKRLLEEAGVSPTQVPLKIIHPLLEAASLEESPSLQAMWANLLANSADSTCKVKIQSAFQEVLRQMSSEEAEYLKHLFDYRQQTRVLSGIEGNVQGGVVGDSMELCQFFLDNKWRADRTQDIKRPFSPSELALHVNTWYLLMSNLVRLSLITTKITLEVVPESQANDADPLGGMHTKEYYYITQFGRDFLMACERPSNG